MGKVAEEELQEGEGGRVCDGSKDEDGCGGACEEGDVVVWEGGCVEMDARDGAAGHDQGRGARRADELLEAWEGRVGEGREGGGGEEGDGVELELAEGRGALEEADDVVVEGEGGGEVGEGGVGCGAGEDPGGVWVEAEVEGTEVGHVGEGVGEETV